jgi:hypothetical protein
MFDSLRKTEGSQLEAYVRKKRLIFNVGTQITQNTLVRQLSEGYFAMESALKGSKDYSTVKAFCEEHLHPAIYPLDADIGLGVAVRDVLELIATGKPMLPENFFDCLVFIQEHELIKQVMAEVTRIPTADELREQKVRERRAAALEQDLRNLEHQLEEAKRELGVAPKVQKASKEAKVKEIESLIAQVRAEGKPLKSIWWS